MMIVLETEQLILRELTMEDLDAWHMILSDKETMQYYPKPFDIEKNKKLDYMESGQLSKIWLWIVGSIVARNRTVYRRLWNHHANDS